MTTTTAARATGDTTATDTNVPLCADPTCSDPNCAPAAETPTPAASVAETAAKTHAFRKYTRLMSDTTRRQRAEKYPNPETVSIADFLAACREEAAERSWCGTAQSMVRRIRVGDDLRLLAQHPQWNPAIGEHGDYDDWAVNPLVTEAGITTLSSADLLAGVQRVLDGGYNDNGYRLGMDNILSRVWCTYVPPPQPTWRAKLEVDITAETAQQYGGFNLRPDSTDVDYVVRRVIQQMIRYDAVAPTWEVVTP